ncbi:unnamed protein product [Pleuronectes platessa]|uniref:Uncharacterized protein n=1 Tax=Pleuronectes platessa TaxID=8262 RepID=A0A9N7YJD3_PLEPL|nr:unnamed protein product [Pleuronectes platessa]
MLHPPAVNGKMASASAAVAAEAGGEGQEGMDAANEEGYGREEEGGGRREEGRGRGGRDGGDNMNILLL